MHTDLPEPVAPAINQLCTLLKLILTLSPVSFIPNSTISSSDFLGGNTNGTIKNHS